MYSKFKSGSRWLKCDFHVHTPNSVLNNQFGNDFNEYVKILLQEALKNKVSVVGITDYFLIDGYKRIKNEYLLNDDKLKELEFTLDDIKKIKEILFIPNIEFRINTVINNSKVNYHIIFSNELDIIDIEENFLNRLNIPIRGSEKRSLTKNNLEYLGKILKKEQNTFKGSDLRVGIENASVDSYEVLDILSKTETFKNKHLIVIPSDEDLSKIKWEGQAHNIRKTLIQQAHCLFSSNNKTIKWGLGELSSSEEFIKEFYTLKPTIHGSDAHQVGELFKPSEEKYCWIKSLPTFEGIRQILFEPKSRVYLGEMPPENKQPYNVIKKVRFIDPKNNFSNDWVYLNKDLNSIIGGKSSGKSTLLYYIARTIIPEKIEILKEEIGKNINYLGYDFEKENEGFDFIVQWADGKEDKLSKKGSERKLTYIPQLYINHIAENKNNKSELNQIILEILKEKEEFKDLIDDTNKKIENKSFEIRKIISNIFINMQKMEQLEKEKIEIGDLEGINSNISKIKEEIEELQKKSTLTKEEIEEYQNYLSQIEENNKLLNEYQNHKRLYNNYFTEVLEKINNDKLEFSNILIKNTSGINDTQIKELFVNFDKNIRDTIDEMEMKIREINRLHNLDNKIDGLSNKLIKLKNEVKEYENKIKGMDRHSELLNLIESERKKVSLIERKSKEINVLKEILEKEELENEYKKLIDLYKEKIDRHNSYKKISNDIELEIKLKFDLESFKINFSDRISKKLSLEKQFKETCFENNDFIFKDEKSHLENISYIYRELMSNDKIKLNQGSILKNLINSLFENYFSIDYDLIQNGDTLLKMSPGKRGIILFQLFLQLSNTDTPILIDQPEDNLDNRTVYTELNNFIKDRKNKRQVIMVSHNANLVVSTDSENIIVANQEVQENKNYNKSNRFEYVTGALEKTFTLNDKIESLYSKGIREHVCEILEGGEIAFKIRELKYSL